MSTTTTTSTTSTTRSRIRSSWLVLILLLAVAAGSDEPWSESGAAGDGAGEAAAEGEEGGGTTLTILGHQQQQQQEVQVQPARGTNFMSGIPFHFRYIFVLGGDCDEPTGWLSRWVKAAMDTLQPSHGNYSHTNVENICSEHPKRYHEYSREFQLHALQKVQQKVGDKLNETLVIADQALKDDYSPVVDLLRQGMGYFHGGGVPDDLSINLTHFNLKEEDVFYLYFALDEEISAKESGREVCRLKGNGQKEVNIAKIYSDAPRQRIHTAIAAFQEECPETQINLVWEMDRDLSPNLTTYKTALRFNTLPDIIFTSQDAAAADVLQVAHDILPPDEANRITATGWDDNREDLLRAKKLLTSVDQMVFHPNRGLWKKIDTIIDIAQENGINSTKGLQQHLRLPNNSTTVWSNTLTTSSDQVGFLIDRILKGYDARVAPNLNTHVSTGLYDVSIIKMIPFEGKFNTIIWVNTSWVDPRLAWSPFIYDGTVEMQIDQIWFPQLYFRNKIASDELYKSAATVTPQGMVTLKYNINSEFLCPTTDQLVSFPFDSYKCQIELAAPTGISLDQSYGFHVIEEDPHFSMTVDTYDADDDDSSSSSEDEPEQQNQRRQRRRQQEEEQEQDDNQQLKQQGSEGEETVAYILYFKRRPFTAYVRLILPAVLINMIGFLAFWIPEMPESVALGITSLLCSLTFRETVEMPDTADVTWTEVFMMVNVCYQASVMLIIWLSYGDRSNLSTRLDQFCKFFHPKKVARNVVLKAPQAAVKGSSVASERLVKSYYSVRGRSLSLERMSSMAANNGGMPQIPENDFSPDENDDEEDDKNSNRNNNASLSGSNDFDDIDIDLESGVDDIPSISKRSNMRGGPMTTSLTLATVPESSPLRQRRLNPNTRSFRRRSYSNNRRSSTATAETIDDSEESTFQPDGHGEADDDSEKKKNDHDGGEEVERTNVDWIGRWIIVPSYVIIMGTLLTTGWGYTV